MRTRAVLWTACLLTYFAAAQAEAAEMVTLEAIKKKWQERQDKVKSARLVWNCTLCK